MADTLRPDERAAIDAALRAGKLQRIERGTYVEPVGSQTGGGKRGHLLVRPGQTLAEAEFIPYDHAARMRRVQVAGVKAVKERAADRARGNNLIGYAHAAIAEREAVRLAEYRKHARPDRTARQVAEILDMPVNIVRKALSRHGLPYRREKCRKAKIPGGAIGRPACDDLRAAYVALVAEGLTARRMATRLGNAYSTITKNLRRYGLRAAPDRKGPTPRGRS